MSQPIVSQRLLSQLLSRPHSKLYDGYRPRAVSWSREKFACGTFGRDSSLFGELVVHNDRAICAYAATERRKSRFCDVSRVIDDDGFHFVGLVRAASPRPARHERSLILVASSSCKYPWHMLCCWNQCSINVFHLSLLRIHPVPREVTVSWTAALFKKLPAGEGRENRRLPLESTKLFPLPSRPRQNDFSQLDLVTRKVLWMFLLASRYISLCNLSHLYYNNKGLLKSSTTVYPKMYVCCVNSSIVQVTPRRRRGRGGWGRWIKTAARDVLFLTLLFRT